MAWRENPYSRATMANTQIPETVARVLRQRRDQLVAERMAMTASLDKEIGEIDAFLAPVEPIDVKPLVAEATAGFNTKTITATADALIAAGQSATTVEIRNALSRAGIPVPPDALFRITKALSRTGRYRGGRSLGWSHKANGANQFEMT